MKVFSFFALLCFFTHFWAQPIIKMDVSEYDYGEIVQGANGSREFGFTNVGDSALIISRVRTGDGGSMAYQKSREPIAPGERGVILFKYDTKRLGPFHRSITITSNATKNPNQYFIGVRIEGQVIYAPTTVSVDESTIDIGSIPYGQMSSATFQLQNNGDKKLHIHALFRNYNYVEGDIFSDRIFSRNPVNQTKDFYRREFEPGEKLSARVTIRNIYGNSGYFERRLPFKYNSNDTIWLTITGTFTGAPNQSIVYEKHDALHYKDGKLVKRITYGSQETIVRIDYFELSNCVKSERFDARTGKINQYRRYRNGVEIEKFFFDTER